MRIRDWRSDVCSSDLERTDNRREQAAALRCQGLLLPDPDARFAAAIDLLSMPPLLPSQARTLLVWGERLLADGRYADARRRLREAAVLFEQVGARSWLTRIDGALATMADDPTSAGASPVSAASVQDRKSTRLNSSH